MIIMPQIIDENDVSKERKEFCFCALEVLEVRSDVSSQRLS
jgi:hypothetical protein